MQISPLTSKTIAYHNNFLGILKQREPFRPYDGTTLSLYYSSEGIDEQKTPFAVKCKMPYKENEHSKRS